jgi:hypothetical protein
MSQFCTEGNQLQAPPLECKQPTIRHYTTAPLALHGASTLSKPSVLMGGGLRYQLRITEMHVMFNLTRTFLRNCSTTPCMQACSMLFPDEIKPREQPISQRVGTMHTKLPASDHCYVRVVNFRQTHAIISSMYTHAWEHANKPQGQNVALRITMGGGQDSTEAHNQDR